MPTPRQIHVPSDRQCKDAWDTAHIPLAVMLLVVDLRVHWETGLRQGEVTMWLDTWSPFPPAARFF